MRKVVPMYLDCLHIKKHPTLDILVREDGAVYNCRPYSHARKWTYGRVNDKGYPIIKYDNKHIPIHRIVAETFLPNPENKPTVDHINRVRDDNRLDNLRWATHKEQQDNTSYVLNSKYGVRACEDNKAYMKKYHAAHKKKSTEN